MKNALYVLMTAVVTFSLFSCQKELTPEPTTPTDTTGTTPSRLDLLRDSVFLYSKEVYLWNNLIPTYDQFNPRQYSGADEITTATNVLDAIRALQPLDRYSFVTTKEESDGLQTGESKDWGFFVKGAYVDKAEPLDSARWFITYVYNQSSAAAAGVRRGWYINKINNTTLGNDNASIDLLNEIFFGTTTSASFEFIKPDGSVQDNDLSQTSFTANSVLKDTVYTGTDGVKQIGYFVFNQFFGTPSVTELNTVFSKFKSKGITELIVDLRYNHGGATATQNALADMIAPASANGKKMYTYIYNDSLQADKFPLLDVKFGGIPSGSFKEENNVISYQNTGSLSLNHVLFIVSNETASASELLINNLRPYFSGSQLKLIGDTTYGKPVGFFGIDIFDYAIYPISFKTVNSVGTADYYTGFPPDQLSSDRVNKDWGDTDDFSLTYALKYINTGSFRMASSHNERIANSLKEMQDQMKPAMKKLTSHKFTGMFTEKKK